MKREDGYYYVRNKDRWSIAQYFDCMGGWLIMGSPELYQDSSFDQIGGKILIPIKQKV